jgi:hypothetical protein
VRERSLPVDRFLAALAHAVLLAPVPTLDGHAIGRPVLATSAIRREN